MLTRLLITAPVVALLTACAVDTTSISGEVVSAGIYAPSEETEIVDTAESPSGKSTVSLGEPTLRVSTTRIPAKIGTHFGMVYRINNVPCADGEVEVTKITRHPPMKRSDGTLSTQFVFKQMQPVRNGVIYWYTGYSFDELYEAVPGQWEIEITIFGKSVVRKVYEIYN